MFEVRCSTFRRRCRARGSALIVVLWVVGLMSMLLASFAFDAHVEARITSYYRKRAKADALARSGIEVAKMLMVKSRSVTKEQEDAEDRWLDAAKRLQQGSLAGLVEELGEGTITLDIVPEPARRNINSLGKTDEEVAANLERIFEVGGIPDSTVKGAATWDELTDSFLDWTDANDEARVNGAETDDYYSTLTPPYQAKNGPLDTVGELLLIRGFTRTILSGGVLDVKEGDEEGAVVVSGIEDLLTTYGKGKVNINAASERVLRTLPGVDEPAAKAIQQELFWATTTGDSEYKPFENTEDLLARVPGLDPAVKDYVETDSSVYRITSVGSYAGVKREVWCIAEFDAKNKDLDIKRWREQD